MLSFTHSMFPFILGVILVCGLWIHDISYRYQELSAGKVTQLLPWSSRRRAFWVLWFALWRLTDELRFCEYEWRDSGSGRLDVQTVQRERAYYKVCPLMLSFRGKEYPRWI